MRYSPSCVERPLTDAQPPLGWAHAGDVERLELAERCPMRLAVSTLSGQPMPYAGIGRFHARS